MKNHIAQWVVIPSLFLLITALALTACTDTINSSDEISTDSFTSAIQNANSSNAVSGNLPNGLTPNSVQYNNSSKPVATGKSGGVTLTARAMINSANKVDLEVTSGELDSDEAASGTIARLQVKALNPDTDRPDWVENHNNLNNGGSFSKSYTNLAHGQLLDLQANVREMFEGKRNSARTGVISFTEEIKYRPDLAVNNVMAPAEATINDPVFINAYVSENLGDLGARADCILRIDGVEIGRAEGIWVDAGDAVTCSFQTQFETTGTKNGEVSLENVIPGDYDYGNNSATFQIDVTNPIPNHFTWRGYANIEDFDPEFDGFFFFPPSQVTKMQYLDLYASSGNITRFPMDIEVDVTSGGHPWLNESYSSGLDTDGTDYVNLYLANNSTLYIGTYEDGTFLYLIRHGQGVVYYTYDDDFWNGNYYSRYEGDPMLPYGNDVTFKISLNGSEGSAILSGEIPLVDSGSYGYRSLYGYGVGNPD